VGVVALIALLFAARTYLALSLVVLVVLIAVYAYDRARRRD
jgi:hypothetical protein